MPLHSRCSGEKRNYQVSGKPKLQLGGFTIDQGGKASKPKP